MTVDNNTTTAKYLQAMVEMRRTMPVPKMFRYSCMEELVLTEGIKCKVTDAAFKGKRMEAGNCFGNCTTHSPELTYCEGWAGSIIPLHHAWLITKDGEVIDPTWDDGKDYIGIPFNDTFVFRTILRKKTYGVIDDYAGRWPLLSRNPPKGYRSKRFPV